MREDSFENVNIIRVASNFEGNGGNTFNTQSERDLAHI